MDLSKEQLNAINVSSGALLSAGAGSGKTFVIIEHIVSIISIFLKKNDYDKVNYPSLVKDYLSKIIITTFTVNSSKEMESRLIKRINTMIDSNADDSNKWIAVKDNIGYLFIGTLHSFFLKVLSNDLLTNELGSLDISDEYKINEKIKKSIEEFFITNINNKRNLDIIRVIISDDSFIKSFNDIFSTPSLRYSWFKLDLNSLELNPVNDFIKQWAALSEWKDLFNGYFDNIELPVSDKKWCEVIKYILSNKLTEWEDIRKFFNFFNNIGRWPICNDTNYKSLLKMAKLFRDNLNKVYEDLKSYQEEDISNYKNVISFMKEAFDKIDNDYADYDIISYSDIEYYLFKALQNKGLAKRLSQKYSYFIIDEFQDTSQIQFDIITNIIQGDFSKLFCVGDPKQAIYGFRGGELNVFFHCKKKMGDSNVLNLKSNYRSLKNIVSFNNKLFNMLLYEGCFDKSKLIDQDQKHERLEEGLVKCFLVDSIDNINNDFLEAICIRNIIRKSLSDNPTEDICVLYRHLRPSRYLIYKLIESKISFTSQIKIPYFEDPVLGIFKILLETFLNINQRLDYKSTHLKYCEISIQCYLEYLQIKLSKSIETTINIFFSEMDIYGISLAFKKFINSLNICISYNEEILKFIYDLEELSLSNVEKILDKLSISSSNREYVRDFYYGDASPRVKIMTIHKSKGLEFSHVIMGGIYSNTKRRSNSSYFGKNIGSFRWKVNNSIKTYKSPFYILEELENRLLEKSESNRLFYVLCSRARNKLSWVNIKGNKLKYNTWVDILNRFCQVNLDVVNVDDSIKINSEISNVKNESPFFHLNNLGILEKIGNNYGSKIAISSDISITGFSTIAECPRKFYLKNICRINEEELDALSLKRIYSKEGSISNKDRGSNIHINISKLITGESTDISVNNKGDEEIIKWIYSKIASEYKTYDIYSEKSLKFTIFGYLLSGILDVLMVIRKIMKL